MTSFSMSDIVSSMSTFYFRQVDWCVYMCDCARSDIPLCVLTDDGKADDDAKTSMPAKMSLLKVSDLDL